MLRRVHGEQLGKLGKLVEALGRLRRSIRRTARCIHARATPTRAKSSMKQLVHTPMRSFITPKQIGRMNPPSPPIIPTSPPTEPTCSG